MSDQAKFEQVNGERLVALISDQLSGRERRKLVRVSGDAVQAHKSEFEADILATEEQRLHFLNPRSEAAVR